MGWTAAPDRFLLPKRKWMPRWRFRPAEKIEDAFRLLDGAKPESYTMVSDKPGEFEVQVKIAGVFGRACLASRAEAITLAVARAVGIDLELPE
jgi:hypothetical protein